MDNYASSEDSEEPGYGKNCTIGRTRMIEFEKDRKIIVIIQKYGNR